MKGEGQLLGEEMRVGWSIMMRRYGFDKLAMAPVCEPVCVCAIALAAAAAHLAAYHNKGAQLIRPQSKGNSLKGKKGEDVKGDLKYAV